MTLELQDVASAMEATGEPPLQRVSGWSVDTRTQNAGDVYFALKGPNHDGHAFVGKALEKGASAVVIEERSLPVEQQAAAPFDASFRAATFRERSLLVPDTLRALQDAGRWARDQWGGTVVGVTGSAGKTTTKDAIADLLSVAMPVGRTIGNLNNHVGVPLSILRLPDECCAAVLEMGMNHAGEIRELASIARPQIGVITNVGYAHVEFFENGIDGVAAAKRELIEALPPDGVAVLNGDDPRVCAFRDIHPGRSVTFGFSECAEVRVEQFDERPTGARFRALGVDFETAMVGRHSVMNLLAALAVASILGIAPDRLREAVRHFAAGKMRGERLERNGIVIWNDCYNSNPEAAKSMIDVLHETPAIRRIAVLGEMLELGRSSVRLHREVGQYAAEHGVDFLIGIRGDAQAMVDAAGRNAVFLDDAAEAGRAARRLARSGDAVLFKGSRGVKVERALEAFLEGGE